MKTNYEYETALKIKKDFQYLVGRKAKTKSGRELEIRELAVLPLYDGEWRVFAVHYQLEPDKHSFIARNIDKEMTLAICFTDDSFYCFFQYLKECGIPFDQTKYI